MAGNHPASPPWGLARGPRSRPPGASCCVDRHLGMYCSCALLDCCHNEQEGELFNCGRDPHVHVHSGNPATGYLYPWTQEEYDAQQRYWDRPDPDDYPEGSLERLATEALLEEWRKRERNLRQYDGLLLSADTGR